MLQEILSEISILMPLIVPVVIWAMLLIFFLSVLLAVHEGIHRLQQLHRVPCNRCLYNTKNPYLRCPIHPLSAFSERAIGCHDFESARQHALAFRSKVQANPIDDEETKEIKEHNRCHI
jgi:hypothetical protein